MRIMNPNKGNNNDRADTQGSWKHLLSWHQSWCKAAKKQEAELSSDISQTVLTTEALPAASTESSEKRPKTVPDPLSLARVWIKHEAPLIFKSKALLDRLFKSLLGPPPPNTTDEQTTKDQSLKHLQWIVVLLLEIRVQCPEDALQLFYRRFSKLQGKLQENKISTKKRKRKQSALDCKTPEQIYQDFLIHRLTQIVFLLPSNQPFGTFLAEHCLTHHMWRRIPTVVSNVLNYFEVDNPYLPKPEEKPMDAAPRKIKKKPSINKEKQTTKQQPTAARRPLLLKRDNRRISNHFHGRMTDVAKMLDTQRPASATPAPKKAKTTTPTTATAKKTIAKKTSIITPHPPTASKEQVVFLDTAASMHPTLKIHKVDNKTNSSASTTTASVHVASFSCFSPVPTARQSLPPVVAETPVPTTGTSKHSILETPIASSNSKIDHLAWNAVEDETPHPDLDSEGPGWTYLTLEATPTKEQEETEVTTQGTVKPMKLFTAIRNPKKKAKTMPLLSRKPESGTHKKARHTSAALAAARSFLRRKSM